MSYFKTCPNCGANLDPGEKCDCQKEDKMSAFNDVLLIGYDQANSNDIPVLVIGRRQKSGIHIIKTLTGEEATKEYEYLAGYARSDDLNFERRKEPGINENRKNSNGRYA